MIVRLGSAAGVLLAALSLATCTLATARSGVQCESVDDCRARGGDFRHARCSNGVCEPIAAPDAGTSGIGCQTTTDCLFRLGRSARCVAGSCVSLAVEGCNALGDIADDDAVLLAVLTPFRGAAAAAMASTENQRTPALIAAKIVNDWNAEVRSDAGAATGPRFWLLSCNESALADPGVGDAILEKIAELRPAAVIGPLTETRLARLLGKTELPVFAPYGDSPLFVERPDPRRRLWSCAPSRTDVVGPLQRALEAVAKLVSDERGRKVKIAFVSEDEGELEKRFAPGLALDGNTYVTVQPTPPFDPHGAATIAVAAHQVVTARADVVVIGGPWMLEPLVSSIETRWQALNAGLPEPVYLGLRAVPLLQDVQFRLGGRAFAVDWERSPEVEENYRAFRAVAEAAARPKEPFLGAETSDCLYAAMYSVAAAAAANGIKPTSVTPKLVEQGAELVSTGPERAQLRRSDIRRALSLIDADVKLVMVGAAQVLAFDPKTGMPPAPPASLFCLGSERSAEPMRWTFAGVRLPLDGGAPEGGAVGAPACP